MKAWVYITSNKKGGVIYTGVTSDIKHRLQSHKTKKYPRSFTARYNADRLVDYEEFDSIIIANERENQIKSGSRVKKIKLIEGINLEWDDLYNDL